MTDPRKSSDALDAIVREARSHGELEPRVDDATFNALEDAIVARMAAERSPLVDDVRASADRARPARARVFQIGAVVLAAAAAVALVMKRDPGAALIDHGATTQVELNAGSLRAAEGPGEVRVGGKAVSAGHVLRAGDLLEVDGARAVLERPRKVTWLLENASAATARAHVKSAGEPLVVGLDDGAIEAQVTPVPSGEAFAVDVAAGSQLVRVAVHGTHLRVARNGSRVVIDLTEGVVSIGVPPRAGSTYGTLVTAPSHVEFDAANLDGTLQVDHTPSSVRLAVALSWSAWNEGQPSGLTARADLPHPEPAAAPLANGPAAAAPPSETVPRPASVPRPGSGADPSRAAPTSGPPSINPTKPSPAAREVIAAAVRDCAAARSRPDNVRVTVTSSLKLKISAGGAVDVAQFDPPLLPEIQTCAATAIYKAKLEDAAGGTVTIPIAFTY